MNPENKKLIMFDFDGVLVDTLLVGFAVTKEANANISIDEYKTLFEDNINKAIELNKVKKHPNFFERYDIHAREIKVPEIIKEIIKILYEKYILIIISSTGTSSIKNILERDNVLEYFDDILGNDIHTSKVEKIKTIFEKYNIKSDHTIFITDTLGDIKEATKCEVKSIGVTWGWHDPKTLKKGNPATIIDNPMDLLKAIEDMLK